MFVNIVLDYMRMVKLEMKCNYYAALILTVIYIYISMLQYISFDFQITYHEVEPSGFEQNADSSSIYVAEEYFSLSNLQPGRNYSISVQAVSKGIESVQRSLFQATRKYKNFERVLKCHHFHHNDITCYHNIILYEQ